MLAPTYSSLISSDEPRCRGFNQPRMQFPLSVGMLLARDPIVGIPIPCSVSLPASHFTRTAMHDPVTRHLVTLSSLWWCITEWAQRYLSVIRSDKSQSRSVSTQQLLSEIPVMHLYSHPVTLWRLIHPRHSYGIRELHDLMVEGRDTWHWQSSSKTNYTIFYAMLRIGSCPSHHSPNDVIPLSTTSNVHSQETMTICWSQRAGQLEAYQGHSVV